MIAVKRTNENSEWDKRQDTSSTWWGDGWSTWGNAVPTSLKRNQAGSVFVFGHWPWVQHAHVVGWYMWGSVGDRAGPSYEAGWLSHNHEL